MHLLIADDDPLIVATLRHFLEKTENSLHCQDVADGASALKICSEGEIDALFLDLDLPEVDGRRVLEMLPSGLPVIIVSSHAEFGARSYEFDVVDFLVKPLDYARFVKAWQKLQERLAPQRRGDPESIFVRDGGKIFRIAAESLQFLKSESNYTQFICAGRSLLILASLKHLERQLPAEFIRVHRSYLVNLRHITQIDGGEIHIGDHRIPIGDSYRSALQEKLAVVN